MKWDRYNLAEKYAKVVRNQSFRFALGALEAEEVAHVIALTLVMDDKDYTDTELRKAFLTKTKYELSSRRTEQTRDIHMSQLAMDGEEIDESIYFARRGTSTPPNQIEYTYLMEVTKCIRDHSGEHGDILRELMTEETPLGLMAKSRTPLDLVLKRMTAAREWLESKMDGRKE